MRRIINSTYVSLDGLIEHLDKWHFDYLDEVGTSSRPSSSPAATR